MLIHAALSIRFRRKYLIPLLVLFVLGLTTAGAQTNNTANLPITFPTVAEPIPTSACLQVIERRYPASVWWENVKDSDEAADRAFKQVVAALKRKDKDKDALLKLSDPDSLRDAKQFDQQATFLFQQFQVLEIAAVPLAYEFDGLVVFYPKFRMQGQVASFSLAFAHHQDGTFGYLPFRTKRLTFELVEEWFHAPWGPDKTDHPTYCFDDDIRRSTHRVSVSSSDGPQASWHPSSLMLRGAPMDARGPSADLAAQVNKVLEQMKTSLNRGAMDEFIKHLDADGARRTKQWYDSASDTERGIFKQRLADQRPFFLLEASPLIVVYAKMPDKSLQVMYLVSSRNDLLWTNSTHITGIDKLFKDGPLARAAQLEKPFSDIAIK